MKETRVPVDHIELQIREYESEGDPILFLHFSGANLMMWKAVVPYFQEPYHLVLVDLRGHGKSDQPPTGYDMDHMAADVVGVMDHLGLERAHVVGSSLGAEVGLALAANAPGKVISLVCDGAQSSEFGPYGTWEGSEDEFETEVTNQLERMRNTPETRFGSVDALVTRRREILDKYGWWNEYVEAMERYGAHELADGQVTSAFRKEARIAYMEHYFHYRLEDYYRRVRCPLLLVTGEEDPDNEEEEAARQGLMELAPQAEIARIPGWVHPYGWMLDPEPVSREVLRFLRRAGG